MEQLWGVDQERNEIWSVKINKYKGKRSRSCGRLLGPRCLRFILKELRT